MLVRSLLYLIFTFFFYSVSAQVTVGVFAGPQRTTASYHILNQKQPTEFKQGAHAGVLLKVPFENQLYFTPMVNYSLKGYKVAFNLPSFPPSELAVNNDTKIHTLEISPLLHYDLSPKDAHFFIKAGPSIDVNLSGREKFEKRDGKMVNQSMKFSFADYGFATASAIVQVGYETAKGFTVAGQYAHGMASMNNADGGPRIMHRVIGITFGKLFYKNPNVLDTRVIE
jgi:hypothetical protein